MAVVEVVLACKYKHVITFGNYGTPKVGERIWDIKCRDYFPVESVPLVWRAACGVCSFARATGINRADAHGRAQRHSDSTGHACGVVEGTRLDHVYDPAKQDALL